MAECKVRIKIIFSKNLQKALNDLEAAAIRLDKIMPEIDKHVKALEVKTQANRRRRKSVKNGK